MVLAFLLIAVSLVPSAAGQAVDVAPVPPHLRAAALAPAIAIYREISAAGGWPSVPPGPNLRLGDVSERVRILRARLAAEGYAGADPSGGEPAEFDSGLELAILAFQRRHGLEVDGVVGPLTLRELNIPASARVRQIELNQARLAALPPELGERYVAINIADQRLQLIEAGEVTLASRLVVGKPTTPTPRLTSRIDTIVFNPAWHVPTSIAANEILPRSRRDPGYLRRENIVITETGWLVQRPGPGNSLGQVKFDFPSAYSVYLHDTPERRLFERARRLFSHGCIRLEKPRELALHLLRHQGWDEARIDATIEAGDTVPVRLLEPVPIWVFYITAFMESDGKLQFREDAYGLDVREDLAESAESTVSSLVNPTPAACGG